MWGYLYRILLREGIFGAMWYSEHVPEREPTLYSSRAWSSGRGKKERAGAVQRARQRQQSLPGFQTRAVKHREWPFNPCTPLGERDRVRQDGEKGEAGLSQGPFLKVHSLWKLLVCWNKKKIQDKQRDIIVHRVNTLAWFICPCCPFFCDVSYFLSTSLNSCHRSESWEKLGTE